MERRGAPATAFGVGGLADVGRGVEQLDRSPSSANASGGISISTGRAPPASQPGHRLVHRAGDLAGLEHALLPRGDRADEVELVVDLVEEPEVAADAVPVDLTCDQQDGGGRRPRRREARAGVVDADAGDDERDARPARRTRVPVGHDRWWPARGGS